MYGLPKSVILVDNFLEQRLSNHGYYQVKKRPELWKHVWRLISFALVVEHYGNFHVGQDHSDHLMSALKIYDEKITTDWEGKLYCGITIKWCYTKQYC